MNEIGKVGADGATVLQTDKTGSPLELTRWIRDNWPKDIPA